jgi:hypothetical protein
LGTKVSHVLIEIYRSIFTKKVNTFKSPQNSFEVGHINKISATVILKK